MKKLNQMKGKKIVIVWDGDKMVLKKRNQIEDYKIRKNNYIERVNRIRDQRSFN